MGLPVSCRAWVCWTVLRGLGSHSASRPPCFLPETQTAGPWQQNKHRFNDKPACLISNTVAYLNHPQSKQSVWFQSGPTTHWAQGLLWVWVHAQLFVHGVDIDQVHGVGAFQEGLVCLADEVIILRAHDVAEGQVKFV